MTGQLHAVEDYRLIIASATAESDEMLRRAQIALTSAEAIRHDAAAILLEAQRKAEDLLETARDSARKEADSIRLEAEAAHCYMTACSALIEAYENRLSGHKH